MDSSENSWIFGSLGILCEKCFCLVELLVFKLIFDGLLVRMCAFFWV